MTWQVLAALIGLPILVLVALAWHRHRMPIYQWYCRRCKKIVCTGRSHPGRCTCGTNILVAHYCENCRGWNTTPNAAWHCADCSSKKVLLGVEYHLIQHDWRWRNRN